MKKAIISFVVFVTLMTSCNDKANNKAKDTIPAAEVPAAVTSAFNAKYPGVTGVKWEKESETQNNKAVYQVEFKQNGKDREAKFDAGGGFLSEKGD